MRYIRQRNVFTCGPVAVINAIRWAGGIARYEDEIDYLMKRCQCDSPYGSEHNAFERTLREEGVGLYTTRRVYRPTIAQVTSHLLNDGGIVLNYQTDKKCKDRGIALRHLYLLVSSSPFGLIFGAVNRNTNTPAFDEMTFMELQKDFKHRRSDSSFKAWFLTKEKI